MKIGIVGPGALGTFLSGVLGKKNRITLLGGRDLEISKVEINEINGRTESSTDIRYTTDPAELRCVGLVIICTKSYDTREAVDNISTHLKNDTAVLSLQNGLKNEKIISEYVEEKWVIGGITSHGITYERPGRVIHTGEGDTVIGRYPQGDDEITDKILDTFEDCGLPTEKSSNIYGHIWKKVIVNAGINPITALTGLNNGGILENEGLRSLMRNICSEAVEVAEEETKLPVKDPISEAEKVARRTADNRSSMLQDIENERKTEIDCINGAIIRVGRENDIDTPYNEVMYELVKGKESPYL